MGRSSAQLVATARVTASSDVRMHAPNGLPLYLECLHRRVLTLVTSADPHGLTLSADGTLYVADSSNGRVVAFNAHTLDFAFSFQLESKQARAANPLLEAVSAAANQAVAASAAAQASGAASAAALQHGVSKRAVRPRRSRESRESRESASSSFAEAAARARVPRPAGIAVCGEELFVTDAYNRQLQVFALDGTFRRFLQPTHTDGSSRGQLMLTLPEGLAAARGRLYVSDKRGDAVFVLDPSDGSPLQMLPFLTHKPHGLAGVAADGAHRVYVLDEARSELQVLTSAPKQIELDAQRRDAELSGGTHPTPNAGSSPAGPGGTAARPSAATPSGTAARPSAATPSGTAARAAGPSAATPSGTAARAAEPSTATPSGTASSAAGPSATSSARGTGGSGTPHSARGAPRQGAGHFGDGRLTLSATKPRGATVSVSAFTPQGAYSTGRATTAPHEAGRAGLDASTTLPLGACASTEDVGDVLAAAPCMRSHCSSSVGASSANSSPRGSVPSTPRKSAAARLIEQRARRMAAAAHGKVKLEVVV